MDDASAAAHAALYDASAAVSAVATSTAAVMASVASDVTVTTDSIDAGAVAVHNLALGIDDADDLLQRHAMEEATGAVVETPVHAELPPTMPTVPGTHPNASISAVYRFYEIETTLSLKRREESSIAKCRLCRQEGRPERKSCVRFSKSVTSNLWRHLKENHPTVYEKHVGEKKAVQMHRVIGSGKRGRKKKKDVAPAADTKQPASGSSGLATLEDSARFLEDVEAVGAKPRAAKRARRQAPGDQFFNEYALAMGGANGAVAGEKRAHVNLDRVREAAAYMCVHEMVPFDLCSSMAFRSLLNECHAGSFLEDATTVASVLGKQAVLSQSRKLMEETKDRIATQLKAVEGVHLQAIEWPAANAMETQLVGVFGVTLDQEFNSVRRCLCVIPVPAAGADVSGFLDESNAFKLALKGVPKQKYVPNLLVVEPSKQGHYAPLCEANKLKSLESITSLLREIMVSTITGVSAAHAFIIGDGEARELPAHDAFRRGFDDAAFVEAAGETEYDHAVEITTLCAAEVPSSILTELPNVLTGHTIRDILLKVLHFVAHIKQSKETRLVMRQIMVTEFRMEADMFTQLFERALSLLTVGVHSIYEVLTLTLKMTPTLQRYFELHKDGSSDLSKLMQLASLSTYEWERVGYLASLLKPFAEAVEKLHEEKYVASSLIVPSVFTLLEKLRTPSTTDVNELPEDMVALKNVAYAQLSAAFGYLFAEPAEDWEESQRRSFNWLWSATLLDPRTRPFILKGALSQAQFWEVVKSEATEISGMNKAKDQNTPGELNGLHEHGLGLGVEDPEAAAAAAAGTSALDANGRVDASGSGGDLWDDLQANLASCAQEEMLLASSKSTLELTKSTNLLEVEISFLQDESRISLKANPLEWWQTMRAKYPYVARLARYVLSIPSGCPVDENPMRNDAGLVRRLLSQMPMDDVCELVAASLNLRLEGSLQVETSSRQMWSTV